LQSFVLALNTWFDVGVSHTALGAGNLCQFAPCLCKVNFIHTSAHSESIMMYSAELIFQDLSRRVMCVMWGVGLVQAQHYCTSKITVACFFDGLLTARKILRHNDEISGIATDGDCNHSSGPEFNY